MEGYATGKSCLEDYVIELSMAENIIVTSESTLFFVRYKSFVNFVFAAEVGMEVPLYNAGLLCEENQVKRHSEPMS